MRVALLCFLLVPWVAGCGPSGGGSSCVETLPESPRHCDASVYELTSIPELLANPGAHFGHLVETLGIADWYVSQNPGTDCGCVDAFCTCPKQLALRSAQCGSSVLLGGTINGSPVECSDVGCSLTILVEYDVCGTWKPSDTFGEPGMLEIHYAFLR